MPMAPCRQQVCTQFSGESEQLAGRISLPHLYAHPDPMPRLDGPGELGERGSRLVRDPAERARFFPGKEVRSWHHVHQRQLSAFFEKAGRDIECAVAELTKIRCRDSSQQRGIRPSGDR